MGRRTTRRTTRRVIGSTNDFFKQAMQPIQALQGVNQDDVATAVGGRGRRTAARLGKGNTVSTPRDATASNITTLATLGRQRNGLEWDMAVAFGQTDDKA